MKYLLDTNTCIVFLNGRSEALKAKLLSKNPDDLVTCSVVKAELCYGSLKSQRPEENLERQSAFVNRFKSLPFDDHAARIYGQIRKDLETKGTPIGPLDLLIASIALANELVLVTHNVKEFSRINNLIFEDWEI